MDYPGFSLRRISLDISLIKSCGTGGVVFRILRAHGASLGYWWENGEREGIEVEGGGFYGDGESISGVAP